jgi:molybdate transport system regulatory protein
VTPPNPYDWANPDGAAGLARIRIGIDIQKDGPKLGHGKVHLLKAIRDYGSISAAARSMEMSYRHAWVLLDELNRCFAEPVIRSTMGGSNGGGAKLTAWGEELIVHFEEMERIASQSIDAHLEQLEARLVKRKKSPARKARTTRRSS